MAGAKSKRAYGVSCRPCREKKISCDGARPRCGGCANTQERCTVPASARPLRRLQRDSQADHDLSENPSNSQLAEKLKRVERRLREVEDLLDVPSQRGSTEAPESDSSETANGGREHALVGNASSGAAEKAKYRLTINETGHVIYHGLTGWTQGAGPEHEETSASNNTPTTNQFGMTEPEYAPIFQGLASSRHISVAPALGDALLETYFSYQVFNIIQKSTFLRDMALGGPMFSDFLLMCIYASAARRMDGIDEESRQTQGDVFEKLAKEYLAREMEGPTRIPTIMGLLLLSGRQCAAGNVSQGWNSAGLAFRMIQDLGIHLDPEKVAGASNLSQEELATRDRLFWSAFIWDKSMSLAMGREPTFPPRAGRDPSTMAAFDDDEEPWTGPQNAPQLRNYMYQPKRRVAVFKYHAQLCLILHDIIMELYSTESRLNIRQRKGFIQRTKQQMEYLWGSVPDNMKFSPSQPSPPPWIFMFQMLYHATAILLLRLQIEPHQTDVQDPNVSACLNHAVTANQMAVSFTETFSQRMTYMAMYSSFVATSFDIHLLDSTDFDTQLQALVRLNSWIGIMEKSVIETPSIRRSVHHIAQSTRTTISKYPLLMSSEPGQWINSLHTVHIQGVSPLSTFGGDGTGVGSFDFFELFDPLSTLDTTAG